MFNFEKKGILGEIMGRASENAIKNLKSLDKLINSELKDGTEVSEIMSPSELFNAVSNYLECHTVESVDGYKELAINLQRAVMTSPVFEQYVTDSEHGYYEIGLSLITLGNRLMELETTEEEVVREKLDAGTLTKEDALSLAKANLRGLPEDLMDKVGDIVKGDSKDEAAATTTKVKVNDKNSMVELIKKGSISTPTLYILLQSKEVTTEELRDNLDSEAFAKTMGEVNDYAKAGGKDLIPYPAKKEIKSEGSSCHDCESCNHKDLCNDLNSGNIGDIKSFKERIAKLMADRASDESDITDDEKVLRRAIDKGYVSSDDIVQAVSEQRLNPFYIEVRMKKEDPQKYAEVSVGILRRNSPDVLKNLGPDPVQTILRKLIG